MGLWSRFFRRTPAAEEEPASEGDPSEVPEEPDNTVALPTEPYVFECRSCGKVFEARRRRPACPECDSTEVSLVSE